MVNKSDDRISVVDGLRGFAIIIIVLLHSISHFNLLLYPITSNIFLQTTDLLIKSILTTIFTGSIYGIFALLFGFTFYLQLSKQEKRGNDFKYRFIWRMLILFIIGIFNSAFFSGEILMMYSVIGLILVPLRHQSNKSLLIILIIFILQPLLIAKIAYIFVGPGYTQNYERYIPNELFNQLTNNSFFEMLITNLTIGKHLYFISLISSGERIFQTAAFFIVGLLLGRQKRFENSLENICFWKNTFIVFLIIFTLTNMIKMALNAIVEVGSIKNIVDSILCSWSDFSIIILFTALFYKIYSTHWNTKLKWLEILGEMSLTNYLLQSIVGSFLFYGYGLFLSKYCGITISLFIGIIILFLQYHFCKWWLKHHPRGPLEQLWHNLTWIKVKSLPA